MKKSGKVTRFVYVHICLLKNLQNDNKILILIIVGVVFFLSFFLPKHLIGR